MEKYLQSGVSRHAVVHKASVAAVPRLSNTRFCAVRLEVHFNPWSAGLSAMKVLTAPTTLLHIDHNSVFFLMTQTELLTPLA